MRLTSLIIFSFILSVMFSLMGFTVPLFNIFSGMNNTYLDPSTLLEELATGVTNPQTLASMVSISLVAAASILTGFGTAYILPMLLFYVITTFGVLPPLSFILSFGLPEPMGTIVTVILNIFLIIACLTFVRGGGT